MKYISINKNNNVCFKDDNINIITNADVLVSNEIYAMFFEKQSIGMQFKIKNIKGTTFEEIFEEYKPTNENINEQQLSETDELKQRIAQLEAIVETLLKDKQS